jgi:hypothetical protein
MGNRGKGCRVSAWRSQARNSVTTIKQHRKRQLELLGFEVFKYEARSDYRSNGLVKQRPCVPNDMGKAIGFWGALLSCLLHVAKFGVGSTHS